MRAEMDLHLRLPNHALFIGASMSGKTRLVLHLLQNIQRILCPIPKTILFYFDQHQEAYEEVKHFLAGLGIDMQLIEGSGDTLTLQDLEKKDHQTLIIIDDATETTASSHDIAKITTNGRHKNVSLWLIWHSLYSRHAASRLITQNVSYLFLLPSVRLTSQLHTLDSQLRFKGALVSAYKHATEQALSHWQHKYLLLDMAPDTPLELRFRSQLTSQPQYSFQKL